jgi:hypothetical protein
VSGEPCDESANQDRNDSVRLDAHGGSQNSSTNVKRSHEPQ